LLILGAIILTGVTATIALEATIQGSQDSVDRGTENVVEEMQARINEVFSPPGSDEDDDSCPNTVPGDVVNNNGCSIPQLCPTDATYKNHGAYVSCVARTAEAFLEAGLITEAEKGVIVSAAAKSDVGKKKYIVF
jgi:hypothetical protein